MCVAGSHPCGRGAERAGSVDVLTPGVLVGRTVGAGPEAVGGAGGETVDVASEDHGAGDGSACEERAELGALRSVRGYLIGLRGGKVSGAYIDARLGC